jgi:hypothetical protein
MIWKVVKLKQASDKFQLPAACSELIIFGLTEDVCTCILAGYLCSLPTLTPEENIFWWQILWCFFSYDLTQLQHVSLVIMEPWLEAMDFVLLRYQCFNYTFVLFYLKQMYFMDINLLVCFYRTRWHRSQGRLRIPIGFSLNGKLLVLSDILLCSPVLWTE